MKSVLVFQVSYHFAIQSNPFNRKCQQFFTIDVIEMHRNQSKLSRVVHERGHGVSEDVAGSGFFNIGALDVSTPVLGQ